MYKKRTIEGEQRTEWVGFRVTPTFRQLIRRHSLREKSLADFLEKAVLYYIEHK